MYVIDQKRQISLIGEMTQLRKDSKTWEVYYHHPSTNVMWKSYFPKATPSDRGPKVLRTEPVPEHLENRLKICLVEESPENAIGLGIELSTKPEEWSGAIDILEANYRDYHRNQLPLFLKQLGVEEYKSLFKEIGFNLENSSYSQDHFDDLCRRSKKIRFKRFWFL